MDNIVLDNFLNCILSNSSATGTIVNSEYFHQLPKEVQAMYINNQQSNLRKCLSNKKRFADTVEITV